MKNLPLFFAITLLMPRLFQAQNISADSVWIETGNIKVCLRNNGTFYTNAPGGAIQFRQETATGGEKWMSIINEAALWMGAVDPAGNLLLSVPRQEPLIAGFRPGIAGVPNSDKIWKVTFDEVMEHLRDFTADGVVDEPVASIFAWPSRGNRFSLQYNGFAPPSEPYLFSAPYTQYGSNGNYAPDKGDIPNIPLQRLAPFPFPDQVYCVPFHAVNEAGSPARPAFPMQGWCYVFAYKCPQNPVLDQSVIVSYIWQYTDIYYADSCMAGFYVNPDVGNPSDDYHGSLEEQELYFAYNADNFDEGGFEDKAPLVGIQAIQGPLDNLGFSTYFRVMPVGPANIQAGNSPHMSFPQLPVEFYRFLTCAWRDGSPLTLGGNGYGQEQTTTRAFTGNPFESESWSEINNGNIPGDRRAVLSWHFQKALPGAVNQMSLLISVAPPDSNATARDNFENFKLQLRPEVAWLTGLGSFPDPAHDCVESPYVPFSRYIVRAYPTPANDVLHIQTEGRKPRQIRLYDHFQRMIREINVPADTWYWPNPVDLPVRDLPPGMYFLEATSWETIETVVQKILIAH